MFNTYCNEVPILYKLINTEIYHKLVDRSKMNIKNITHILVNFIDDSTNIIGFKNHEMIKTYLEQYQKLISKFYNINKLKLNNDKNELLIINRPCLDNIFKNFQFKAGNEIVKAKFKIKILGFWIQKDLKMDSEINKLSSTLHNRINNIKKITKYTDFKSRLHFINAYVIGKLNYMLPMYSNLNKYLFNRLHKIQMTAARAVIGNYCFKKVQTIFSANVNG